MAETTETVRPYMFGAVRHEVMITHIQLGANCSRDVAVINKVNPLCLSSCRESVEGPVFPPASYNTTVVLGSELRHVVAC